MIKKAQDKISLTEESQGLYIVSVRTLPLLPSDWPVGIGSGKQGLYVCMMLLPGINLSASPAGGNVFDSSYTDSISAQRIARPTSSFNTIYKIK